MYLKRLEIHGFKSFAHKTVLDFEPGLTAVVGPNGSGKSNVADAIRWVMGEQSMKLLRGKKSEDVIFAGSDKKSKLSMAEVGLLFDNKDRKLPFEYSEVEIKRRVYRSGESEYLVNNQRTRLLDIVDALTKSGFGATNYAVIGQGTIDQMVLAGPAEIKNLIEEASGVKPYYVKRDKSLRRLEQTEENLTQVSQLINEIEPRLKSLRRQAKRMEERESLLIELKGLQQQYYGNQFFILETELSVVKESFGLKQKQIVDLEKEVGEFQKLLEREEQENKQSSNFVYELSKKINSLEQKRFKLQEDLAEIRGKLKTGLIPGQVDKDSLSAQKLELQRELESAESKLKTLANQLDHDEKNFKKLTETLTKLNSQIELARNNKIDLNLWHHELESFKREFLAALDLLSNENFDDTKRKLKEIVDRLTESKTLTAATDEDLSDLQNKKEVLVNELHQLELRLVEQRTLKTTYLEEIESQTLKLNQVKSLLKDSPETFKTELGNQEQTLSTQLADVLEQIEQSKKALDELNEKDKTKKGFLMDEEKKFRKQSSQLSQLKDEQNTILVEKARVETRVEALVKEAGDNNIVQDQVQEHKKGELHPDIVNKISKLKHQLELAGGVDETVLAEYRETEERFTYLSTQSADLAKATNDLRQVIEELDEVIKKQFDEAYDKISNKFVEYFRILFNGGRAQMTLLKEFVAEEGEETPELDEEGSEEKPKGSKQIVGIEIKATPPGKKLSSIAALSGGERALTSIALLCAMLASYPSPFVVLDEVDAALDEANSIRFAKILGTLAHQTQFVTITHNRETMRQGHTLYGVTMTDEGISKILSLKLEQAEKTAPHKAV